MSNEFLNSKSYEIRQRIMDIFQYGNRGHIPSAFSVTEILSTLYFQHIDSEKIKINDPNRDRVILSKGHGCLALYAILNQLEVLSEDELKKFCRPGSNIGGHPTKGKILGIEASTGSLGLGPSVGVGMALQLKRQKSEGQVYVITGDGEINEGSVWESLLSCGNKHLNNFTLIVDYNKFQSYSSTKEVCDLEPLADKFRSFKFEVLEVDMIREPENFLLALREENKKPKAIICHTIKGQGSPILEGNLHWHHKSYLKTDQIKEIRDSIVRRGN